MDGNGDNVEIEGIWMIIFFLAIFARSEQGLVILVLIIGF